LRLLVNCSERATHKAQADFAQRFRPHGLDDRVLGGCWAMAETTFALTHGTGSQTAGVDRLGPAGRSGSLRLPLVSAGTPLPGVEVSVRDPEGRDAGERSTGELWVRAPFLASGYLGNATATSEAFAGGWYRTGDLGYRVGEQLYVTGREKDVLVVAGHNVFPEDVEAVVSAGPGLRPGRVAAFSLFDERLQSERVVVLAEPSGDPAAVDVPRVLARLVAQLGVTSVQLHLVDAGWLVKSSSGKIARRASATKWLRDRDERATVASPAQARSGSAPGEAA
ncbi:MAG: AMP-binding protein, partial [Acidimicrobiales bacterium]